eukprot:9667380-Alexandrium_andersonii.AAC.1
MLSISFFASLARRFFQVIFPRPPVVSSTALGEAQRKASDPGRHRAIRQGQPQLWTDRRWTPSFFVGRRLATGGRGAN